MGSRNTKGIVLLGHPRSGTTLTRRLLNSHSRIASPPETHLLSACGRFLESEKTISGLDIGALSGLNFAGIDDTEVLKKLRQFAFSFLDDFTLREGKQRWAEKTAFDAFHIKNIQHFIGQHALYIGIVRHPLDVAMSCIKFCDSMGFYPKDMHKYIVEYSHPIEAFVHSWLDVSKDLISLQGSNQENCQIYRYEDLVSNTESTLTQLLSFVGEDFEEQMLVKGFSSEKQVGFGDHKSYQSRQVHNDSVGNWSNIPQYQLQKVASLLNPTLEHFGYPVLEQTENVSVAVARKQYATSMKIVAQRELETTKESSTNIQPTVKLDDKTNPEPRISIYGNATTKRSEAFSIQKLLLDSSTAKKLFQSYGALENCFNVVMLTLLHRIGEDNYLKVGLCRINKNGQHSTSINAIEKADATFCDLLKNCKEVVQNTYVECDNSLISSCDIVLNYFEDIELFESIVREVETAASNSQSCSALSLYILADKEKSCFTLVFNFNDAVWLDENVRNRTVQHFKIIFDAFCENIHQNIESFPLLTKDEKHLLESEESFDILPEPVIKQFIAQLTERAQHKAVVCGAEELTYEELGRRVSVLSELLQSKGVRQSQVVAICLERSTNLVIALLAVMHAGGTYVPLDPDHPQSRISQILEDSAPQFIITEEHLSHKLSVKSPENTYLLSDNLWENNNYKNLEFDKLGELAYIIFTSGSTGRPKGVEVYQSGLSAFLAAMAEKPGMNKNDRLLSVTTISFDIAALEIFLPLTLGATLFIAKREETMNGMILQQLLTDNRITCFQATPATYHILLANNWSGSPELKLLCGGEAMPPELAKELLYRCSSLWNMYGPTETTIWSTVKKVEKSEALMPIGKAIRGTRTYVLNDKYTHVPLGVAGELYIAGEGVTKGYHNRVEQTEERYISDIYSQDANDKMYRTGDLVKVLDDGDLVYLGRLDNQVKIRGYRIELGDIEAAIKDLDGIKQCVVNVYEINNRSKSLVAYIVAEKSDTKIEISALKDCLKPLLPEYMIPSFVVHLDEFPLTPNNKVDRKALPTPRTDFSSELNNSKKAVQDINSSDDNVNTNCAGRIVESWQAILRINNINLDDSFVTLGGDSLSFVQITIELEKILGHIPDGWESQPIKELSTLKENSQPELVLESKSEPKLTLKSISSNIDTTIFVRAFAMLSVVFMHAFSHWGIKGNTSVLFMVAGLLFAKFQLKQVFSSDSIKPILVSAWRIFLPSTIIMGAWLWWNDIYMIDTLLLYSNLFGTHITNFGYYWYIQVLLQILFILVLLFSIKPIFNIAKFEPFKFGLLLLVVSFLSFLLLLRYLPNDWNLHRFPAVPMWYFMLGWCIYFSDTSIKRVAIGHILGFFAVIYFFLLYRAEHTLAQPLLIFVLGVLLLCQSKVTLIKPLNQFCYMLASSSLFVYLVHMPILQIVPKMITINSTVDKFIAIGVSLVVGYIFWKFWEWLVDIFKGRKVTKNKSSDQVSD
jgi:amino acid adenylation domain-containing protein